MLSLMAFSILIDALEEEVKEVAMFANGPVKVPSIALGHRNINNQTLQKTIYIYI